MPGRVGVRHTDVAPSACTYLAIGLSIKTWFFTNILSYLPVESHLKGADHFEE